MAGDAVRRSELPQDRLGASTDLARPRATRMEAAACRWRHQIGNAARNTPWLVSRIIEIRHRCDQALRIGMTWASQQLGARSFLHYRASIHHGDPRTARRNDP